MIKNRIYFKNANALIYEGELENLTNPDEMTFIIGDALHRWEVYRVKEILICADSDTREKQELARLVDILRNYDFKGSVIPISEMIESDPATRLKINRYILSRVKVAPTLLLYPASEEERFISYITTIPMTAQKERLEPETAIRLITGRTHYMESDRSVFEYKKFLQPDYTLPLYSDQDRFEEPSKKKAPADCRQSVAGKSESERGFFTKLMAKICCRFI